MLIPEHKVEEVLERTDIVELVGRYVELKKSGRSYKGRCPFHQEKSASFHVTPELRRFKCFGCQAGGDAIAFIQRYLGKTFVDSVKDLARAAGVEVEAALDPSALERQHLREATDAAQEHFHARLWDSVKGQKARAYLAERGVTEEGARLFGLGLAAPGWSDLADRLNQLGILEWGLKAGLVARRQTGEGFYDMFRDRLIVPIRSPEGRTIAFGGRLLEAADGPKYLNSRESKLYNKSETLYGMDQAREEIRKTKTAILVEGYFDCIGLHLAGVKNAVALCSTALTPGHLKLLARAEAKELVLLLDGDEAGRSAVHRLAGSLLAQGMATRVALLPNGEDPDTFARKVGAQGVKELLGRAQSLTEYLFTTALPEGKGASFEAKMRALDFFRPLTQTLPVGLVRSVFFTALGSHMGLPASELESTLRGKERPVQPAPKPAPPLGKPPVLRPPDPLEAMFTVAAMVQPQVLARDVFRIQDELSHSGLRSALAAMASGEKPEDVLAEMDERLRTVLETARRQLPPEGEALDTTFAAVCRKLKIRRIDEQLTHIARLTSQLVGAHELTEETRRLQGDRIALLALRKRVIEENTSTGPGTKEMGSQV